MAIQGKEKQRPQSTGKRTGLSPPKRTSGKKKKKNAPESTKTTPKYGESTFKNIPEAPIVSARPANKAQKSTSLFKSPLKPLETTTKAAKAVLSSSPKTKKTKPKKPKQTTREARLEEYLKSKATNDSYKQGSQFQSASLMFKNDSKEREKEQEVAQSQYLVESQLAESSSEMSRFAQLPLQYREQKQRQRSPQEKIKVVQMSQEDRRAWEHLESLRLKNQELQMYIQQLQRMQKKTAYDSLAKQMKIKHEYEAEKKGMENDINSLKQEHVRLTEQNASLQQLYNEEKQCHHSLNHKMTALSQEVDITRKRERMLTEEKDDQRKKVECLSRQLQLSRKKIMEVEAEKASLEVRYRECFSDNQKIKRSAEEMLKMVTMLRNVRENEDVE